MCFSTVGGGGGGGGHAVATSLCLFVYHFGRGVNALAAVLMLAVARCLATASGDFRLDVTSSTVASVDFCTEQMASNDSCFNQYLRNNQFDYKGLPSSATELKTFCNAFDSGMDCLDTFVETCLDSADKAFYDRRMAPVRMTMTQLCSTSELQREYLLHASCYDELSADWSRCAVTIKDLVEEEERHAGLPLIDMQDSRQKIRRICLAKEQFLSCLLIATEAKCNRSAVTVLQQLAKTLSNSYDNEACLLDDSSLASDMSDVGAVDVSTRSKKTTEEVSTPSGNVPSECAHVVCSLPVITMAAMSVMASLRFASFGEI